MGKKGGDRDGGKEVREGSTEGREGEEGTERGRRDGL